MCGAGATGLRGPGSDSLGRAITLALLWFQGLVCVVGVLGAVSALPRGHGGVGLQGGYAQSYVSFDSQGGSAGPILGGHHVVPFPAPATGHGYEHAPEPVVSPVKGYLDKKTSSETVLMT